MVVDVTALFAGFAAAVRAGDVAGDVGRVARGADGIEVAERLAEQGFRLDGAGICIAPNNPMRRRLFETVSEVGDSSLPAGFGATNKFGDVRYSTLGSAEDVALARYHESAHSLLSPKFKQFRELRADIRMSAYNRSSLVRYLEEAIAESYAQLRVSGIRGLPKGLTFPIKNGYVTIHALAAEGAWFTITVGGVTYYVFLDAK